MNIKLAKKNKAERPEEFDKLYGKTVEKFIRRKYSVRSELAILRQRDSKPEEFAEYNSYCEECKSEAKKLLDIE